MLDALKYDADALRAMYIRKLDSSDIGQLVFEREIARRNEQDQECEQLLGQIEALKAAISDKSLFADQARVARQAKVEAARKLFDAAKSEAARSEQTAQAEISTLQDLCVAKQRAFNAVASQREAERAVRDVSIKSSTHEEVLAQYEAPLPPPLPTVPPLSILGRINLGVSKAAGKRF